MRVFSVEMLVKEEGAAVVEAALKRLKNEAKAVAAEMKVTTTQVTSTGRAMREAGQATEISGTRAAKAAIGFAAVGQSLARTGSLTADAGTRIIEAGSNMAMMFGTGGIVVSALLAFAAAAVTSFGRTRDEAKKTAEEVKTAMREMVMAGDVAAIDKKLKELEDGLLDLTSGRFQGGLDELRARYAALNAEIAKTPVPRTPLAVPGVPGPIAGQIMAPTVSRQSLIRQRADVAEQIANREREIASYRRARELATSFDANAQKQRERIRQDELNALKAFDDAYYRENERAFNQRMDAMDAEAAAMKAFDDQFYRDSLEAFAYQMDQEAQRIKESFQSVLGNGIAEGISGGVRSGVEMAIASGDIAGAFKAMGQSIIRSMASAIADVAVTALKQAEMLKTIMTWMSNPWVAIPAIIALIAYARSLGGTVSGGTMTAIGSPSGLSYGMVGAAAPASQIIFGATSATTAAGMTPRSATNVTIIGPNDPSAQRAMQELLAKAESRGRIG